MCHPDSWLPEGLPLLPLCQASLNLPVQYPGALSTACPWRPSAADPVEAGYPWCPSTRDKYAPVQSCLQYRELGL